MNPYERLEREKQNLTKQQYRTIKGQIKAGDEAGAMKGLSSLLRRGGGTKWPKAEKVSEAVRASTKATSCRTLTR